MVRKKITAKSLRERRKLLLEFFKPTILRVTLTVFYIAVCFKFLSGFLSVLKIIPCKIQYFPGEAYRFGFCTVNPTGMKLNTIYFGSIMIDQVYLAIYLLFMVIILPYVLSCVTMHYYVKFIRSRS